MIDGTVTRPDDVVLVARIAGAWGIQGWIRLHSYSAEAQALQSTSNWWLCDSASQWRRVEVAEAKLHSGAVVAKLVESPDRSAAEALKGAAVYVERSAFPAPAADEYYWVDLIGSDVVDLQGEPMGRVEEVLENAAHAILAVVRGEPGGSVERELIPFVGAHVREVDIQRKRIVVDWSSSQ